MGVEGGGPGGESPGLCVLLVIASSASWAFSIWQHIAGCNINQPSFNLQSYVHQLGILLVQASETPNQEASSRLDQLSIETGSLLICMALSNPTAFKAMQSTRLDNFEEVSQPDSFFTGMLVSVQGAPAASLIRPRSCQSICAQGVCPSIAM